MQSIYDEYPGDVDWRLAAAPGEAVSWRTGTTQATVVDLISAWQVANRCTKLVALTDKCRLEKTLMKIQRGNKNVYIRASLAL